jgi:hypothetical protein
MTKLRGSLLLLASLFVGSALLVACAEEEEGYECDVTWYDMQGGSEVGSDMLVYPNQGSAQGAVDACKADEDTLETKPAEANYYECSCNSR